MITPQIIKNNEHPIIFKSEKNSSLERYDREQYFFFHFFIEKKLFRTRMSCAFELI